MIDLYEERLRFSATEDLGDGDSDPNDRRACSECGDRECDLRPTDLPLVRLWDGELCCQHCKQLVTEAAPAA